MPWVESEQWVQEKFGELEEEGVSEITVILDKKAMRDLGIKTSATFGSDAEKAVRFAEEMARKGHKVLLASPTKTGFLAWTVESDGLFHEVRSRTV